MKRIRYAILAALIGAVAAISAVAMGGTSGTKATGDVWWNNGNNNFHAIFTAQGDTTTAKGTFELQVYRAASGEFVRSYSGTVDCYYSGSDNTASFSGEVTATTTSGTEFAVSVVDNGQGANATADLISAQLDPQDLYTKGDSCYQIPASKSVYDGNLQVH